MEAQSKIIELRPGMSMYEIERSAIIATLEELRFNRTRTAKVLGIGIRTLQRKIKHYKEVENIAIEDFEGFEKAVNC